MKIDLKNSIKDTWSMLVKIVGTVILIIVLEIMLFGGSFSINSKEGLIIQIINLFR